MTALIFCLPHAGGGSHQYQSWAPYLHPGVEWVPIDYPGHFARADEPLAGSIDELARTLSTELLTYANGRPFGVFGHSMGAAVALEIAHQLSVRESGNLRLLMISSAAPPHCSGQGATAQFELSDEAFAQHLVRIGGLSEAAAANAALLSNVLPLIRHDYRLYYEHRAPNRPPLDVPMTVFWGHAETVLAPAMPGWIGCSRAFISGTGYPGAHFYWRTSLGKLAKDVLSHARHHIAPSSTALSG